MTPEKVIDIFRGTGALLEGHFIYASGRHGSQFLQAARVLQYPNQTEALCTAMAKQFMGKGIDLVAGPATGGILLAYETARQLNCRAVFTEKDGDGGMVLKRGFTLEPGMRTLVVEDVITTGGSVKQAINHLRARGAEIVGLAALVDRSQGEAQFDCPFEPLATLAMESWNPDACALCDKGVSLVEPDDLTE